MALLDIQPINDGHTLLIPTTHTPSIADLDDAITGRLFTVARRITEALYKTLGCDGVNWLAADGEAAGQEVLHFHLHLIPRRHNDGFGFRFPDGYNELPSRQVLDYTALAIRDAIKE